MQYKSKTRNAWAFLWVCTAAGCYALPQTYQFLCLDVVLAEWWCKTGVDWALYLEVRAQVNKILKCMLKTKASQGCFSILYFDVCLILGTPANDEISCFRLLPGYQPWSNIDSKDRRLGWMLCWSTTETQERNTKASWRQSFSLTPDLGLTWLAESSSAICNYQLTFAYRGYQ